ncbi:MAG TPA: metallophosphoesterase [Chitinophagaceae bacterium]|nr:metallophosphoesterase [Chitinophagaceae bacterium]
MRRVLGSGIFILIMLLIDWYVFQAIKHVSQSAAPKIRLLIYTLYWLLTVAAVTVFLFGSWLQVEQWPKVVRIYVFATLIGVFIAKFIAASIFLVDDLRRLLHWGGGKLYYRFVQNEEFSSSTITRSTFMSWLGIGLGTTLFGTLLWGFGNKYRYKLQEIAMRFKDLPEGFRGLRIIHISDIHSGSFTDKKAVEKGVELILDTKPDIILFTGDLVNDRADEMHEFKDVFAKLTAPLGVYSTLGNHDYGDYASWPSPKAKAENLEQLKAVHGEMGWKLLMNEHVVLEKEGHKMALLGIENWSAKANFARYGSLTNAYRGSEDIPFKILMSHDPSHWDAEVKNYKDIHLTLSGHTHGMQFGVEIPWFKWSPVQYVYKQWAGLYEDGHQKLYVNRGFGFIGYPGRVGILPEITLIELV